MVTTRSKTKVSLNPIGDEQCTNERSPPNDDLSECNDIYIRRNKRTRTRQATTGAVGKKHVRGKCELKGLLMMPVDIFTEIAYLLNPGDLLALAWSNRFLRNLLLQRSTVHMWRRAYGNSPDLPPCPPDMCEPRYAALVFTKVCTTCGTNTMAGIDVNLLARLCGSCRDTELQELNLWHDTIIKPKLVRYSVDIRPTRDEDDERRQYTKGAVFAFRRDVEEVQKVQQEFRRKRDRQGLAEWENERSLDVVVRRRHNGQLRCYLGALAKSYSTTMDKLKEQRKNTILERLEKIGWTQEDLFFTDDEAKPWNALVEAPKLLTDRIWTIILPKLTRMLEENRERHIAEAKKQRQLDRRTCVNKFLISMKLTSHPFEFIFQALGVPTPPAPELNESSNEWLDFFCHKQSKVPNPFPRTTTMLRWSCLKDIDELDMSVEEAETKMEERMERIHAKALGWRTKIEEKLVKQLESKSDGTQVKDVLVIAGDAALAARLPRNTRILLRADTLFEPEIHETMVWSERPQYYPYFVSRTDNTLDYRSTYLWRRTAEINPASFEQNAKTQRIVQYMLRNLDMPDASHIELQTMGKRFMCARCVDEGPQLWTSLVHHILRETWLSDHQTDPVQQPPVRHPITNRSLHDIEDLNRSEPLIRLLDEEAATKLRTTYEHSPFTLDCCYLCDITAPFWLRSRPELAEHHLRDKHDVTESVQGIHYGSIYLSPTQSKEEWYTKWDGYHDALEEMEEDST